MWWFQALLLGIQHYLLLLGKITQACALIVIHNTLVHGPQINFYRRQNLKWYPTTLTRWSLVLTTWNLTSFVRGFRSRRKCTRWPYSIFFTFVDVAVVTCFKLFNKDHYTLKRELAFEMVMPQIDLRKAANPRLQQCQTCNEILEFNSTNLHKLINSDKVVALSAVLERIEKQRDVSNPINSFVVTTHS